MSPALLSFARLRVARQPGSEDDLGPFLNVVTWVLLITSTLAVSTRLVTKRALKRRVDVDDAFVVAALIASIGSGVAVSIQTANGLGRDINLLAGAQIGAYEKSEYASKLLYIATLALAKLSIISLLMILTASDLHRNLGIGLTAFIALWGIVGEFVAAFQCGIEEPWHFVGAGSNCLSVPAFWRGMGFINMLTDLALILFPLHVIFTLQMSVSKKATILGFFGARSLDIIATGIQIAYIPAFTSPNSTRALWKWTLMTQVIQCITIITSCVPYLRPLLESLPSGLYGADELRRRGTPSELGYSRSRSKNGSASYKLSSTNSTSATTGSPDKEKRLHQGSHCSSPADNGNGGIKRFLPMLSESEEGKAKRTNTNHTNSASGLPGGPRRIDGETDVEISAQGVGERWDADSTGSQVRIVKTTVVCAEWERRSADGGSDEIGVVRDER